VKSKACSLHKVSNMQVWKVKLMKVKIFLGKYFPQTKLCFTLMPALIVTSVESVEQAKQPHWMHDNVYDTAKVYECFMKKLSLRELFIGYLGIVCVPTIEDTGNSCFCVRQGVSHTHTHMHSPARAHTIVMSDNIVLNANFPINTHTHTHAHSCNVWQHSSEY
jgi:hypothetical protein